MGRMRIDKMISNMGYGSRKDIKKYILKNKIKVNDKIITTSSLKIDPNEDIVTFDGEIINFKENIYIMMNKPNGVISSTESHEKNVIDLLKPRYQKMNLFPAGRLDKDTEGLLLITNDGKTAHNLLSPKRHVKKIYYVEVDGLVNDETVQMFNDGIVLEDGYKCMKSKLEIIEQNTVSKVKLTIKEGKYHQIKRMFKMLDMKVTFLKRIKMGKLELDLNLHPGQYRELTEKEELLIRQN